MEYVGKKPLKRLYYLLKAKNGDERAQTSIGFTYSMERKRKKALYWLTKAAEQGNTEAMKLLSLGYSEVGNSQSYGPVGFGFDSKKEIEWLKKAADKGDLEAICNLAREYTYGLIVTEDEDMAIKLYEQAIVRKYPKAYIGLADIYKDPTGKNNPRMAIDLLEQAVCFKDREIFEIATFSLGNILGGAYVFNGIEQSYSDRRKAAYCFCLSYVLGNDIAGENLRKLGYLLSDYEFERWKMDAINLNYCFY